MQQITTSANITFDMVTENSSHYVVELISDKAIKQVPLFDTVDLGATICEAYLFNDLKHYLEVKHYAIMSILTLSNVICISAINDGKIEVTLTLEDFNNL